VREMKGAIASTPGVQAVSMLGNAVPLTGEDDITFWKADQPKPRSQSEMGWTLVYSVEPEYLSVTRIPLKRGRFFSQQDTEKSPRIVVVDDVFAATFFPKEDALGKRIRWTGGTDPNGYEEAQIVGIVGHIKQWGLD